MLILIIFGRINCPIYIHIYKLSGGYTNASKRPSNVFGQAKMCYIIPKIRLVQAVKHEHLEL